MLRKRIATAIVLIPLVVGAVYFLTSHAFVLFLAVVGFLCAMEFSSMFFGREMMTLIGYPVIISGSVFYGSLKAGWYLALPVIVGFVALAFISLFVSSLEPGKRLRYLSIGMLGFVYIYLFLPFFSFLRDMPRGEHLIFFIGVTVYIGDTAAYFVGSRFGKVKLAPTVSPGKTVEGAIASTLFGTMAGSLYLRCFYQFEAYVPYVLLPLLVSTVGQMGDLVESLFKRAAGVKDSGNIFPGHGGMLDRIDSMLLNAFVVFFYLKGV